jgi:hypothetical protein
LKVSPRTGSSGTVLSISGKDRIEPGTRNDGSVTHNPIDVVVQLTTTDRQTGFDPKHVPVHPDGSWSGTLTVPAAADPALGYQVNAHCLMGGDAILLPYEPVPFRVTR